MKLLDQLKRSIGYHRTHPCTECAHYIPPHSDSPFTIDTVPRCRRNTITIPVDPNGTCDHFTSTGKAKPDTSEQDKLRAALQSIAAGNLDDETQQMFAERCVAEAQAALSEEPNASMNSIR